MENVSLDMIWKRLEDVQADIKDVRDELARGNENSTAIAKTLVTLQRDIRIVQRDLADLKNQVTVLTIAGGDDDRPHV
jgi:hypothetical protein